MASPHPILALEKSAWAGQETPPTFLHRGQMRRVLFRTRRIWFIIPLAQKTGHASPACPSYWQIREVVIMTSGILLFSEYWSDSVSPPLAVNVSELSWQLLPLLSVVTWQLIAVASPF